MSDNGYISIDNRPYVCMANAGTKIAAAIADLPPTGGVVDARSLWGNQNIDVDVCAGMAYPKQVTLLLGHANFRTTVTQTCLNTSGQQIIGTFPSGDSTMGAAYANTRFIWDGPAGGTVLLLDCTRDSQFENFAIIPGGGTIGSAIRIDHASAPTTTISTHNVFSHISIGASETAVLIGNTSTYNNDQHIFNDTVIVDAGIHGFYINNAQTKYIQINGGNITARTHGIYCDRGNYIAKEVMFSNNTYDNSILAPGDPVLIQSCQSEGAHKFLHALGPTGVGYSANVTLQSNRAATNNVDPDNIYLEYHAAGPLLFMNNQFYAGGAQPNVKTEFTAVNYGGAGVMSIGNFWWDVNCFSNSLKTSSIISLGDISVDAYGNVVHMPNWIN